jgi:HK97 family phage portal protein
VTLLQGIVGARASIENPAVPLTGDNLAELFGGGKSHAGVRVSEVGALNSSAVFRAVSLGAGIEASLPLDAFVETDDGNREKADENARRILRKPHPDMTRLEWRETLGLHRRLWGNSYCRILRGGPARSIQELWPIHPGRVKAGRTSETGKKIYSIDGGREVHDDATILHIPGMGYDGTVGISPISLARQSIGLGLAAEEFGSRLFGSGALATGILQTEQRLTQKQADQLADRWKAKRTGMESAHGTIVLDKGANFHQLTIPPEDAQFLETRQFQITEICRWYGIPPFLMYQTEKSTSWGTGLEQQATGWVTFDMRRELERVEQRLTMKLLEPDYNAYAKHNVEGLLRGDSKARSEFYTSMWNLGALSTNEIRNKEDMADVEGGDARYRPLNMGQLGEFDTSTTNTEEVPA